MTQNYIVLRGVNTHNLKNLHVRFPHRKMTVITGVSGSGKSSLAFDTLFAEGQRRFLESMSTYARQFLNLMPRPPVDDIHNILPAIALRQQSAYTHPRSTVASVTEILYALSIIYSRVGLQHCVECASPVKSDSSLTVKQCLDSYGKDLKFVICVNIRPEQGETIAALISRMAERGYKRLWIDKRMIEIDRHDDVDELLSLSSLPILIDRLSHQHGSALSSRTAEAVEHAFELGNQSFELDVIGGEHHRFDTRFTCEKCGCVHQKLRSELFNPNSTLGACPLCTGFGRVAVPDWKKIIENPRLSIEEGAICPLENSKMKARKKSFLRFCQAEKISVSTPWMHLSAQDQHKLIFGRGEFHGINGMFEELASKTHNFFARMVVAYYRTYDTCPDCDGCGLSRQSANVTVGGKNVAQILNMTVDQALDFFKELTLSDHENESLAYHLHELRHRLSTLSKVGLGYLTLRRQSKSLSGGETQRLHLSSSLGRGLSNTLYVLDEPSAGLHAADTQKLIGVLNELVEQKNTLVVVEHDTDIIKSAQHVIELGPLGGENGGRILYEGSVAGLAKSDTPTGKALQLSRIDLSRPFRAERFVKIRHATMHNIEDLDIDIPLGTLLCVTGVSGSGKSTLIRDILFENYRRNTINMKGDEDRDEEDEEHVVGYAEIYGMEDIRDVLMMGQNITGRSTRANIASMSQAYDAIRKILAKCPEAVASGMDAGYFSFNSDKGRCPHCEGQGTIKIEMHFLSDIEMDCEVCNGKRFKDNVLEIRHKGKNIDDILNLTVDEALEFFKDSKAVVNKLNTLKEVGLSYLRLGQTTSTLSGGEFQRIKLCAFIEKSAKKTKVPDRLFIFDEPTVGLHSSDVENLVAVLKNLVKAGNSVIAIEHNVHFIAQCDYVIDMGPGGGPNGGKIVYAGDLPGLLDCPNSLTAAAVKEIIFPNLPKTQETLSHASPK